MRQSGNAGSRSEQWIGAGILLCLLAVAGGVFLMQFSFNPAVLIGRYTEPTSSPDTASAPPGLASLPPGLKEFGPVEAFTPDNLYDKIDGKAELYLAAGFVQMHCQRFALKDAPDQWFEWFVYDMGNLPQAFSVFSTQRRAEGQTLDLTPYAYKTQNALYFVCGSNYIEAVASAASEPLTAAMLGLATRFVADHPAGESRLAQLEILPTENLVPGSFTLQSSDAFGFDRFKNVFTANYRSNDAEVTAFVTSCADARAAADLRDAYRAFLIANGGKELPSAGGEWGKPIEIMGSVEIVFSKGTLVAGVHSAPSLAAAEQLARRVNERLASKAP